MITIESIEQAIKAGIEGAEVKAQDLTGTSDHFQVLVVSEAFEGKTPIQRHRMVYDTLGDDVGNAIHALSIKAITPDQN